MTLYLKLSDGKHYAQIQIHKLPHVRIDINARVKENDLMKCIDKNMDSLQVYEYSTAKYFLHITSCTKTNQIPTRQCRAGIKSALNSLMIV